MESYKKPVVHKFGDEELSDVTFIVDGEEFNCHKMGLAMRSSYFKSMFFSGFKEKDQKRIPIEADPGPFKQLMEIIYSGELSGWKELLKCEGSPGPVPGSFGVKGCSSVLVLWKTCYDLLKLADQFDMLNYTASMLENYFLRSGECARKGKDCSYSGTKLILAAMYGMEEYKESSKASKSSVTSALDEITLEPSSASIHLAHFNWFLKRA